MKLTPEIVSPLLDWYRRYGRPLPWRESATPYHVWISEIMLQQTRIEAALPYYRRFLEAFPTVADLAGADDDRLMKLWEGLGYYSRARNLKKAAERVMSDFGGSLPRSAEALRTLPGIGDYTAGAIASIAYGLPAPAVDGNVLRVLSRLTADERDVLREGVKREATAALREIYPTSPEDAAAMTQALMELGEVVCIPNGAPHCDACPLRTLCEGRRLGIAERLPTRAKKPERTKEKRTVLLLFHGRTVALSRRGEDGLLSGMWEFPSRDGHLTESEVEAALRAEGLTPVAIASGPRGKHVFSHREWHLTTYLVTLASPPVGYVTATVEELADTYALPSAFRVPLAAVRERLEAL
ncbi:MAG: A/G-specific adenine glycosylase [Clostridia bacterium]|nr:A/G-specific adenine glycosylase [Clostridia bacterium]